MVLTAENYYSQEAKSIIRLEKKNFYIDKLSYNI